MKQLDEYIDQLPGFKMPDSHFRIGSKIHISKFYYGKRFFQNSFFASRVAFLIAAEIISSHMVKLDAKAKKDIKQKGLSIIGYGLYSELLLSLVEQFLGRSLNIKNLTHNVINDLDDAGFVKHYQDVNKYVIIIVPIASTFSTSFKMDEIIYQNNNDAVILEPHINVAVIVDEKLQNEGIGKIEEKFGWKSFISTDKIIKVEAITSKRKDLPGSNKIDTVRQTDQHYFMLLESDWHEVEDCSICFPKTLSSEKPLIVMDKSAVTPALIFNDPHARTVAAHNVRLFTLSPSDINYGHFKREHNHYLFYIRIENFFDKNRAAISDWLNTIKDSDKFRKLCKETDQIVIVAPGHYSNAGFVNLVNAILFSNSANILHYDPGNDHIQNFQLFYHSEIEGKERRLFFVDDSITSGTTFIKTNYYIKHTRNDDIAFDGCLFLLDRSSNLVYENVLRKLPAGAENYFAYANLFLSSLKDVEQECPLCREKERYEKLAENSFLDKLKVHFLQQARKLEIKNLNKDSGIEEERSYPIRFQRKIEGIHRIYEWFTSPHDPEVFKNMSFYSWLDSLLKDTQSPFTSPLLLNARPGKNDLSFESATILKLLTQSPFTAYRPIKGKIFEWVLELLTAQCTKIRDNLSGLEKKSHFTYASFRDFKFLVRRAGLLNANYLITTEFIDFLRLIFSDRALQLLESDCQAEIKKSGSQNDIALDGQSQETSEHKLQNVKNFNVFFVGQIKELLFMNEAKSIHLEEVLERYEKNETYILKSFSHQFSQLIRILNEENGIIFSKFWEFIEKDTNNNTHLSAEIQLNLIKATLKRPSIAEHYRYKTILKFLTLRQQPEPLSNNPFLNYLSLMNFLSKEKSDEHWTLYEKTTFLVNRLRNIIRDKIGKPGVFFVIKYVTTNDPYFFAYNDNQYGTLNERTWHTEPHPYLKNFIEGVKDKTYQSCLSIVEFQKVGEVWKDMYSVEDDPVQQTLDPGLFADNINRLLLVMINKRQAGSDDLSNLEMPQGIIGFFFERSEPDFAVLTDISKLRYLLLLRAPISNFIQNHHENNEFRDWIEANNKQKTALLTGHGREMLINLARKEKEGDTYKSIVHTILLVQRFILDLTDAQTAGLKSVAIIEVFKQIFNPVAVPLENKYARKLKERCEAIFGFEEIENPDGVDVIPSADIKRSIPFYFPIDLLEMICFELFVNAKKNRWIFTPEDKLLKPDGKLYIRNQVDITLRRQENTKGMDCLVLKIRNTGPAIGKELDKLKNNRYHNVKGNNQVAGIGLIAQMLEDFRLGEIEFFEEPPEQDHFTFFEVTLELYNWHGTQWKDIAG